MSNDYSGDADPVFTYDISAGESVSEAVVAAVAAASNAEPVPAPEDSGELATELALDPLYSVVDPDALDAIFRPRRDDEHGVASRVSFPYHGHDVTVHGESHVAVTQPARTTAD